MTLLAIMFTVVVSIFIWKIMTMVMGFIYHQCRVPSLFTLLFQNELYTKMLV